MSLLSSIAASLILLIPLPAQVRSGRNLPAPDSKNPFESPQDVETGRGLFQTHCSYCHGANGEGGRGADLTTGQYRHGGSDAELFTTVR